MNNTQYDMERYYQLRFVGVEISFVNRTTVFINMMDPQNASTLQKVIRNYIRPPCIGPYLGRRPSTIINKKVETPSGWRSCRLE